VRFVTALAVGFAIVAGGAARVPAASQRPILFAATQAPALSGEIYRVDPDGRRVDLSRSPFADTKPAVSPDGRRVAFLSDRVAPGRGPRAFVVGIDGRRLKPVDGLPAGVEEGRLLWSPDGAILAVEAYGLTSGDVYLLRPNGGRVVRLGVAPLSLAWSPDSRLLAGVVRSNVVQAFTLTGATAWRAPGRSLAWAAGSRIAISGSNVVSIRDEDGRLLARFPGSAFAWSSPGDRLAVLAGDGLDVRDRDGRLLTRLGLPGPGGRPAGSMVWDGASRVVLGPVETASRTWTPLGVDLRTGRTWRARERYFAQRSPDGRLVVDTPKAAGRFALRVSGPDGAHARTYGRVPGCFDDRSFAAAVDSLQFAGDTGSLVYASSCAEPFSNLYEIRPDGSGLRRLTEVRAERRQPRLSPDGTRIVYTRSQYTGLSCKGCPSTIWVAKADGSHARALTRRPDCSFDGFPTWSPGGQQVLFARSSCSSPGGLLTMPAAGGAPRSLRLFGSGLAAWGPSRIAYIRYAGGRSALWTARPDGGDAREVAADAANVVSLAWSGDGRLAYLRPNGRVVIVQERAPARRISLPFPRVDGLDWSPDGTRFVVSARARGSATSDLYTLRTDGRDVRRLTRNLATFDPSWR